VLNENPVVGFCANTLDPNPSVEVVLVAAGAEDGVPKPPSVNPPVPAAGVLEKDISDFQIFVLQILSNYIKNIPERERVYYSKLLMNTKGDRLNNSS